MKAQIQYVSLCLAAALVFLAGCNGAGTDAGSGKKDGSGDTTSSSAKTGDGEAAQVNDSLTGSIKIEGSSTVGPISTKAKEEFNDSFPKVMITVGELGTSNGFASFGKKECDISDASRPIKKKELDICKEAGIGFYEIPVAYDGLTFVVNKENDFCKELTVEQLTQIFREDTAAKTWKEVNPEWPDEKISLFIPGTQSGTHDYCHEVLGKKAEKKLRADESTTTSEDDKVLVTGVKGDKYAIGFFGYSYYESSKDELNAVAIVNSAGEAVTPSLSTIENGTYEPFSRPLFIYVNSESYKRAEIEEFVSYYLSNVVEIVKASSYVPLPASIYEQAQKTLDEGIEGTHFLQENGESREGSLTEVYAAPPVK
ncbi:MAG: PstS family phosphate ABC transporter substrate-binding protein [Pirellulaceae bacterium]